MNKYDVSNVVFKNKTVALEYIFNNPGKVRNVVDFKSKTQYSIYFNETTNKGDIFNHVEDGIERNDVSSITLKLTVFFKYILCYFHRVL